MVKIADLNINDTQKRILAMTSSPKTSYEIAAKMKKSYSGINQNLGILCALGLMVKIKKMTGDVIYKKSSEVEL